MCIYLVLAVLGLRHCSWASSSFGSGGCSLVRALGLLVAVVSLVAEHRLRGAKASVVVALGLSSCISHWLQSTGPIFGAHRLSCFEACGILPDQGLNPCLLHRQMDF